MASGSQSLCDWWWSQCGDRRAHVVADLGRYLRHRSANLSHSIHTVSGSSCTCDAACDSKRNDLAGRFLRVGFSDHIGLANCHCLQAQGRDMGRKRSAEVSPRSLAACNSVLVILAWFARFKPQRAAEQCVVWAVRAHWLWLGFALQQTFRGLPRFEFDGLSLFFLPQL